MFAGRYLWWNMIAAMAYVFFAIYFFYVSWLAIRVSGCAAVAGSCGLLETQLNAVIRPYGMIACGITVLAVGVMRIRFLQMSLLWVLALFVWFGASSEFFFSFSNLWFARTPMAEILAGMPIETWFLAALVVFLCFPVELYQKSPEGGLRVMYFVAGFTASYSFSFTIATSPQVLAYVRLATGSDALVLEVAQAQAKLQYVLGLGHAGTLPVVMALALFIASLSYLLWVRKQPGAAPVAAAA
jgi:hypothetical protein